MVFSDRYAVNGGIDGYGWLLRNILKKANEK